jgi:hypothetical protein
MLKLWLAVIWVGVELSVTVTMIEKVPALPGVPLSSPPLLNVSFAGSPVADQE